LRQSLKILLIFMLTLFALVMVRGPAPAVVSAQATGDSLPTRTPSATPTARPPNTAAVTATATSTPAAVRWAARLASNTLGVTSGNGSIFRVFVEGRVGIPIEVRNSNFSMTGQSGSKSEYGPFAAEFAPVPKGTWLVSVPTLGVSLPVEADGYNLAVIEFFQRPDTASPPTATLTVNIVDTPSVSPALSPTPSPSPTVTPSPRPSASPTATATFTPMPTASPTPAPQLQWLGTVDRQKQAGALSVQVRVVGIEGLAVQLQSLSLTEAVDRRCVTGRDNLGQDVCGFDSLPPGFYSVAPEGLAVRLPVHVNSYETATVQFDQVTLAAATAGWQVNLRQNSNGPVAQPAAEGSLFFRMTGQPGQVVAIRSVRGLRHLCEMLPNPVIGTLTCEVSGLPPGVYQIEAVNTGAELWLFVDGVGQADIEFVPGPPLQASAAAVGRGAAPAPGSLAPAPAAPTPVPVVIQPTVTPTITPTAVITATATPAFAWQGRVVETVDLVIGTIGVRAAGLKDHPVVIRSGGWQSATQLTGTKPELGDYATEFGGLAQGEYIIELVDLAEFKVSLGADQFMLVEFRYQPVTSPSP